MTNIPVAVLAPVFASDMFVYKTFVRMRGCEFDLG